MAKLKRLIHEMIVDEIEPGSRVLDLGCGEGDLLQYLIKNKQVTGHGIDINSHSLIECIAKGIPVIHWDLNQLPFDFPDQSYDYTILNQTITQVNHPKKIIMEMLRISREAILGFSNFGSIEIRFNFFFSGRMPVTPEMPFKWYNTPNIRLLTLKDFTEFCEKNDIIIKKKIYLKRKRFSTQYKQIRFLPGLRADLVLYKICHK